MALHLNPKKLTDKTLLKGLTNTHADGDGPQDTPVMHQTGSGRAERQKTGSTAKAVRKLSIDDRLAAAGYQHEWRLDSGHRYWTCGVDGMEGVTGWVETYELARAAALARLEDAGVRD